MGKSVKVTLEKNESIAVEKQYTVSLLLHRYLPNMTHDIILIMQTVRATSPNEALGMVTKAVKETKEYQNWVIANFVTQKTGE